MTPISICIIAKNEEKHIRTFLTKIFEHTKGFPVEVLLADTGSTDRTKEIASEFRVRLLDFTWINDFSAARNFTLNQAVNDWILVLDCDEYLESLDMNALQYFINNYPQCVGMMTRKNHYPLNGQDSIYTDEVERFFNRKYFHYEYIIHEQVRSLDGSEYKCISLPFIANHQGYSGSPEELFAKTERNNALLLQMLEENPDDPYLYFQLGQSYNAIHDDEKACYYYGKGLEYNLNPALEYVQMMVIGYGYNLLHLERYDEALLFENIYDEFATTADFVNLMGLIYLRNGLPLQAMKEFLKATSFSTASVTGANTFIPTYNMGCINEVLGNLETAITLYKKCGNFQPALDRLEELSKDKTKLPDSVCMIAKSKEQKIPVSVCMIAKNEEQRIERCLTSLLPYNFEIIVVDTGSTDKTKEIARKYTPHVYDFTWNDNFSDARNFSLSKASNEWIFMIDCDEWMETLDVEELFYFMENLSHAAGAVTRENITGTPDNPSQTIDRTERFFSKKKFHYTGFIHEQLTPIDSASFECLLLNTIIKHDGYCMTEEKRAEKALRNISLLQKQIAAEPDNPYAYYQLGKGYEMISDYSSAINCFEKALEFEINPELAYGESLIVSYGYCLLYTNWIQKALELVVFYPSLSSSADFVYLMGLIYLENKQYDKALEEFKKAMTFDFAREEGVNTYLPASQIEKIQLIKKNLHMLPISVCIIAKNEEKNMEEFLKRIRPYNWEIIVLDTGSTDRTRDIALQYADIVSDFVWINDFSAARNRCMELATRDYILMLDCDEFLTDIDTEELIRLIESHPHDAGHIIRKNQFLNDQGTVSVDTEYIERLFPKAEYHYEQSIHEQLVRNDQTSYERYITPIVADHTGYLLSEEEINQKVERNMTLLKQELSKDKNNPYILYQIGQGYNMLRDHENAYKYYKKAILSNLDPNLTYMHMLVIAYGNSLLKTNRLEETDILLKIYDYFAVYADFYCLIGSIYLHKNEPLKAMMEFIKASQAELFFIEDNKINVPFYQMGWINECMGNKEAAMIHYKKCQNYIPAEERLSVLEK